MSSENMPQMGKSAFDDPDQLVSLGRNYFSSDFPNPSRTDCPPTSDIEREIESGRMPSDDLRQHLFSCSNCFNSYQAALAAHRRQAAQVPATWRQIFAQIFERPLAAAFTVLALGVVTLVVLYFGFRAGAPMIAHKPNASAPSSPSGPDLRDLGSPEVDAATAKSSLHIEFDSYSSPRGNAESEASAQVVERSGQPTIFFFTLPEGSPPGDYVVSIVGAFGDVLKPLRAKSPDGRGLTVTINLRDLPKQKYRVCVSRQGESPHCRLFMIK